MFIRRNPLFKIYIVFILFSCNSGIPTSGESEQNNIGRFIHSKDDDAPLLQIITKYAENYVPTSDRGQVIHKLTGVPDSIVNAFRFLRITSNPKAEEYLCLIFLKIYFSHLNCCHQGYELRTKIPPEGNIDSLSDPLLYEFNAITKYFDNGNRIEFINSGIGHSRVEKNKHLLMNREVRKEFEKIERISDSISKGNYWE